MDSTQRLPHVNQLALAIKRIYKDLNEIEREPIDGLAVCIPNPNDPFVLVANVMILNGLYAGLLLPLKIILPNDYPFSPPNIRLIRGVPFGNKYHAHVFDDPIYGNTICVDILSNYSQYFEISEKVDFGYTGTFKNVSGWTPGYTLTSILMQMQVFFTQHDKGISDIPSRNQLSSLRNMLNDFAYELKSKDGTIILEHSTRKPNPPIQVSETTRELLLREFRDDEETAWILDFLYNHVSNKPLRQIGTPFIRFMKYRQTTNYAKRIICSLTRATFDDNPNDGYGIPIRVTMDKFNRAWPIPVTEIISKTGYLAQLQAIPNRNDIMSRTMISGWGQPYNIWLPIFIDHEHFRQNSEDLKESLRIMGFGSDYNKRNIESMRILNSLCTILNKLVVNLLKGTLIQSIVSIETYCQILLLLIKLQNMYPDIKDLIKKEVQKMMTSQENRHKNNLGDIGEFLIKLALSEYKFTNTEIKDKLMEEYSARQVLWVAKQCDIYNKNNARIQNFFNYSKVSNQLLVFNIEAAKTFINPAMITTLEGNYGFANDNTIKDFLRKIDEIKSNITNFAKFFNHIGLNINGDNEIEVNRYIDRAINISVAQGYTKNLPLF